MRAAPPCQPPRWELSWIPPPAQPHPWHQDPPPPCHQRAPWCPTALASCTAVPQGVPWTALGCPPLARAAEAALAPWGSALPVVVTAVVGAVGAQWSLVLEWGPTVEAAAGAALVPWVLLTTVHPTVEAAVVVVRGLWVWSETWMRTWLLPPPLHTHSAPWLLSPSPHHHRPTVVEAVAPAVGAAAWVWE